MNGKNFYHDNSVIKYSFNDYLGVSLFFNFLLIRIRIIFLINNSSEDNPKMFNLRSIRRYYIQLRFKGLPFKITQSEAKNIIINGKKFIESSG